MFRKTKHYVFTRPIDCVLTDGERFFSGQLVNLSLYGAFVAHTSSVPFPFDPNTFVWLSTSLNRPRDPALAMQVRASVVWRNLGVMRTASNLPEGLGLEFILREQTLRDCTVMISELRHLGLVKHDRTWTTQTPAARAT